MTNDLSNNMPTGQESEEYPALDDLLGGYFNQDWDYITKTDDPDRALEFVRKDNTLASIEQVISDIRRFIAKYGNSDTELNEALERIFKPGFDFYNMKGRGTRQGLEVAIRILSNSQDSSLS